MRQRKDDLRGRWLGGIRKCPRCGFIVRQKSLVCVYCEQEVEDHREEERQARSIGHFK